MTGVDLGTLVAHLRLDDSGWRGVIDQATARFQRLGQSLESLGRRLSIMVTAPLVGSVKAFASFEDAMTKAFAMFGNLSDEMKDRMTRNAEEISLRSSMSATELAEGYRHLGSAGFSAEESLALLSATERFAVAGTFNLAQATVFAADSLRALGLSTETPEITLSNLRRVTDNFAQANIMASGEINQFAKALTEEAGQAMKVWGIELEEGMAVLAAYHAQNVKAEEAGTAFGRMLRLMIKGFRDQRRAWDDLGVSIYNTQGYLRPIPDIIEDLTNKTRALNTEDIGKMFDLLGFEARSQQVIMPLLGKEEQLRMFHERLMQATEGAGKTAELAAKNLSSFKEQLVMIWHHITWVSRDVGGLLAPSILKVSEYAKELTRAWFGMDEGMRMSIVKWAGIIGVLGPALLGILGVAKIFSLLGATILGLLNPFTLLIALAYTFRAGWENSLNVIREAVLGLEMAFRDFYRWLGEQTTAFLDWFEKKWESSTAAKGAKRFIQDFTGTVGAVTEDFMSLGDIISGKRTWEDWAESFVRNEENFTGPLRKTAQKIKGTFEEISTYAEAMGIAVKDQIQAISSDVSTQLEKDLKTTSTAIDEFVKKYAEKGTTITVEAELTEMLKAMELPLERMKKMTGETEGLGVLTDQQREVEKMIDALDLEYEMLGKINEERERAVALSEFKYKVEDAYAGDLEKQTQKLQEYTDALDKLIKGRRGIAAFTTTMNTWANDATNIWQNLGDVMSNTFDRASQSLTEMIMEGKANFQDFARTIIADLLQMMIRWQMANAMMSFFPGFFGGMGAVRTVPAAEMNPAMAGVAHEGISLGYMPRLHGGDRKSVV